MLALALLLGIEADSARSEAEIPRKVYIHPMRFEWQKYIQADPRIMMGKPVYAGTRIPVDLILDRIAEGETVENILEAHPRLSRQAILASFAFVSQWIRADIVYPVTVVV